jgi:hypothetical protein
LNAFAFASTAGGVILPYPISFRNLMVVITCANETMFQGSGAVSGVPYVWVTFVYAGMPGSVASPNSELAIAYVHSGKSPRPARTWPFRHSGAETIFLESAIPSCLRPLARFTQPAALLYGITMSAVCAPALVSGPIRSAWPEP